MHEIDALLDIFDSVTTIGPAPRPTLADTGSSLRSTNPGRAATDHTLGLDDEGWYRFAAGLQRVAELIRARGYEPTFHPHTATYVEAVWEIERLLDLTDVGLCLDTGHIAVGGGDPAQCILDWASRINHIHIKDANRQLINEIVDEHASHEELWRRRAFTAFGSGDLDLDAVIEAIKAIGYQGWIVVEQDIFPDPNRFDRTLLDQVHNRDFLKARGI
jgi:inosose dehydratase